MDNPNSFVAEGEIRNDSFASRHLYFEPNVEHAKKYNQDYIYNRKLAFAPFIIGLIIIGLGIWLFSKDSTLTFIFAILSTLVGIAITILGVYIRIDAHPSKLLERGVLNPAIIVKVEKDKYGILLLAEVTNDNFDSDQKFWTFVSFWLECLPPNHKGEVGERIPITCLFQSTDSKKGYFKSIIPLLIAWGTPDKKVLDNAIKHIPSLEWDALDKSMDKYIEKKNSNSYTTLEYQLLTDDEIHNLNLDIVE